VAYVERCLAPTLKRNDIVMFDNLLPTRPPVSVRQSRRGSDTFATCPNIPPT